MKERKKERSEVSPKVEKRKSKGGKGEEKRDLSPEPILDPGKRICESFQLAPPLWGGPCISYFHIWTWPRARIVRTRNCLWERRNQLCTVRLKRRRHNAKSIWNWTCRGSELKKLMIGHKKNRLLAMTITRNCYWQKRGKILGMNCHAWFKLFHKKLNSW